MLNETWSTPSFPNTMYNNYKLYNIYRNDRTYSKGGGQLIMVPCTIKSTLIKYHSDKFFEAIDVCADEFCSFSVLN